MGTVEVSNKGVRLDVSVFLYKDGDVYNAYCPELDLVGCDYTEEGARKSFDIVLSDYLEYTIANGTLERDLTLHGWHQSKSGKVMKPTPSTMLRRSQLKSVLGRSEFSKYTVPVTV